MKFARPLLLSAVALACVSRSASAQDRRTFDNSWFWGLKGGALAFSTPQSGSRTTGTFGGDWLITRTRGGLYLSYDMANFVARGNVPDGGTSSGRRVVEVRDLKRLGAAAMVFPVKRARFRPYAGIGASLALLGDATAITDSLASPPQSGPDQAVLRAIDDRRSEIGLLFIAGGQAEFSRVAVFAQGTLVPGASNFLLNRRPLSTIEFGVRYNIGSSIDRVR